MFERINIIIILPEDRSSIPRDQNNGDTPARREPTSAIPENLRMIIGARLQRGFLEQQEFEFALMRRVKPPDALHQRRQDADR